MSALQTVSVFVGIPAAVVILVALPIFGGDWVAWVRAVVGRRRRTPSESGTDSGSRRRREE